MELCNQQADTVHYTVSFFRIFMGLTVFHNSVVLNGALHGIGENRIFENAPRADFVSACLRNA